ncbi:hypothetical protein V5O48_010233 [Marasmius crinis-equi]|uniref:Glycoside hydrolase family 76 protein n=1 Tax=Marasmius crinis-equi TaxID=585013 RepID=A0ABR3F9J7_9AGAR
MAQFDMFAKQTTYKDQLSDFFSQALQFRPGFMQGNVRRSMNWGLAHSIAAIQAYTAYNDSSFLGWAELAWSGGESYTLTEDKLRTRKISGKNITIQPMCSNLTMSGGTFWQNDPNKAYVNSLATSSFMIASSVLAEATPNQTYLDYARSSRDFYVSHLRNPLGDMLDGVDADSCVPSGGTFPANAGLMMEGLAVLMSVSKSDDVEQNLIEIVNKTVSNTGWHPSDGILQADSNNTSEYRQVLSVSEFNDTHSPTAILPTQYNAVLGNARGQGSDNNIYGAYWAGPATPSNFSIQNQTNALSILIAAIPVRNDTTDTIEGPETPTGGPTTSRKPNVGAIAGGVIGGVVVLILLAIFVLWLVRRRRATHTDTSTTPVPNRIIPFTFAPEKGSHRRGGKHTSGPPQDLEGAYSSASTLPTHADTGLTSSQGPSRVDSAIPTAELVRLLNQRLQRQDWREDEQPPDYASQGTPSTPTTIVRK